VLLVLSRCSFVTGRVTTPRRSSKIVTTAVVDASLIDEPDGARRSSRYLTPIANRPLIAHVIDDLARTGIERMLIVAHPELRAALDLEKDAARRWGIRVEFVERRSAQSVSALAGDLRAAVDEAPAVLCSGDCLFRGELARLHEYFRADALDLALLVRPAERGPGGQSYLELPPSEMRLPREQPQGTAMIIAGSLWPLLEELSRKLLSVPRISDLVKSAGYRVGVCEVGDHWCYQDSTDELLIANRMLLDELPFTAAPPYLGHGTEAQGRVSVAGSARISRSTLRGPIAIGEGAVVEDSFIGPYTAIGSGATVIGAEIDYTMVLADAEVRYPGYRLEASVIGERSVVRQSFGLPAGMHLRLGPGAHVTLG
jgi:glucose-1-phosphate thymidylyltransferase